MPSSLCAAPGSAVALRTSGSAAGIGLPPDPQTESNQHEGEISTMTQATSTSSSLLAQLTPMLSDRAVIMVVSNVDDQHLDGVSDSPTHDHVQQNRPPKRRKRYRRTARGTRRA